MTTSNSLALSIVIPAYNEAERIGRTLGSVLAYLERSGESAEILVVSDGSTDDTVGVVRAIAEANPCVRLLDNRINRGKGFSIRRGVLASRGEFVLFSDADLSTPIEEVARLRAACQEAADIVIGSRALDSSRVHVPQPWWRRTMGQTFNRIVRLATGLPFRDTQCGFKGLRGAVARELFARMRVDRYAFDVELLWIARRLGYGVLELPVVWVNSPMSRVNPVSDSARMLLDVLRIRLGDARGRYSAPLPACAKPREDACA